MAKACPRGATKKTIKRKTICLRPEASSGTKAKRRARGKWLQRNFDCARATRNETRGRKKYRKGQIIGCNYTGK